jgi:hypothetical protein
MAIVLFVSRGALLTAFTRGTIRGFFAIPTSNCDFCRRLLLVHAAAF